MNWARTCATTEQLSVYSVYLLDKTQPAAHRRATPPGDVQPGTDDAGTR